MTIKIEKEDNERMERVWHDLIAIRQLPVSRNLQVRSIISQKNKEIQKNYEDSWNNLIDKYGIKGDQRAKLDFVNSEIVLE